MRHMRHVQNWLRYGDRTSLDNLAEDLAILVAWYLPKRVAYWTFIRLAAASGNGPDQQTCSDVLRQHETWSGRP